VMHVKDMEQRARERLLKYHYYMAKAYEYRFLEPYTGDLKIQDLVDGVIDMVEAGKGSQLTEDDFEVLEGFYEQELAELTDGSHIYGETAIDVPRGTQREKIRNVFLVPHHSDSISVYPPAIDAINGADYIIIGPGDLFTSIIPNLIVPGVKEALQETSAKILYIINIMTKFGETHNFSGLDFIRKLEESIERQVDGIIYNSEKPDKKLMEQYMEQKAEFVEIDEGDDCWGNRSIYASNMLDIAGSIVRHDSKKLAVLIQEIISQNKE